MPKPKPAENRKLTYAEAALLDLPLERILNTGDILVWRGSIEVLPLVCIGAYDDRLSSV